MIFNKEEVSIPDTNEKAVVFELHGELTGGAGLESIRKSLSESLLKGARHFILNLEGINYINSSGVGGLMGLCKDVVNKNGSLAVVHLQPNVAQIFVNMDLYKYMRYYEDVETALPQLVKE